MFRSPIADALVVVLILVLFFGPKRLPMLGRGIGEGIKEFKDGISSDAKDPAQLNSAEAAAPAGEAAKPASERTP
jgi:sec-independent protein translocase protein TatA